MRMISVVLWLLLFVSVSAAQSSYVTKSDYIASTSKKMIEQAMEYVAAGDKEGYEQFVKENYPRVFTLKAGLTVYILERTWGGLIRIRVKGMRVEVWTLAEAVRSE
jgi:hypothetical protein